MTLRNGDSGSENGRVTCILNLLLSAFYYERFVNVVIVGKKNPRHLSFHVILAINYLITSCMFSEGNERLIQF